MKNQSLALKEFRCVQFEYYRCFYFIFESNIHTIQYLPPLYIYNIFYIGQASSNYESETNQLFYCLYISKSIVFHNILTICIRKCTKDINAQCIPCYAKKQLLLSTVIYYFLALFLSIPVRDMGHLFQSQEKSEMQRHMNGIERLRTRIDHYILYTHKI